MPAAHELLAARARRIRLVRRRIVAAVLASFVLAWGIVAFDGSMGNETVASTGTTTTSTDTTSPDDTTSTDSTTSADTESESDQPSTMTTSQS